MNARRLTKQFVVIAGIFCLYAVPQVTCGQSQQNGTPSPSTPDAQAAPTPTGGPALQPPPTPLAGSASGRSRASAPPDYFAGLTYTDEQKKKIDEIHKQTKIHVDAVMKDDKLSPEQKDAMLQGYGRLENTDMSRVLTPEQRAEVRRRVLAQRQAEAQKRPQQPQVSPQGQQQQVAPQITPH